MTNPLGYPETPELDKMRSVREQAATLSEFMDFLDSENITLCDEGRHRDEYTPIYLSNEKLFAKFFEIDLNKVETERRAILDWLHNSQTEANKEQRG